MDSVDLGLDLDLVLDLDLGLDPKSINPNT